MRDIFRVACVRSCVRAFVRSLLFVVMVHQVCKRWSLLASDDTLWKALSLSRWPQVQDLFRTTTKSWRWIYKSKGVRACLSVCCL